MTTAIAKGAGKWVEDNSNFGGESEGVQSMLQFRGWSWMAAKAVAQLITARLEVIDDGEGAFTFNVTIGPRAVTITGNTNTGKAKESVTVDPEEAKKYEAAGGDGDKSMAAAIQGDLDTCELQGGAIVLHGYENEDGGGKLIRKITMEPREDGKLNWTIDLTREGGAEELSHEPCTVKLVYSKDE